MRTEASLDTMLAVIPWDPLVALIIPHVTRAKTSCFAFKQPGVEARPHSR